jgi:hypothetical protein
MTKMNRSMSSHAESNAMGRLLLYAWDQFTKPAPRQ